MSAGLKESPDENTNLQKRVECNAQLWHRNAKTFMELFSSKIFTFLRVNSSLIDVKALGITNLIKQPSGGCSCSAVTRTRSGIQWILRQNASPGSVKIPDRAACRSWSTIFLGTCLILISCQVIWRAPGVIRLHMGRSITYKRGSRRSISKGRELVSPERRMRTSCRGRSSGPVFSCSIWRTTSMPLVTCTQAHARSAHIGTNVQPCPANKSSKLGPSLDYFSATDKHFLSNIWNS